MKSSYWNIWIHKIHKKGNEVCKEKACHFARHRPNQNQPAKASQGIIDKGVDFWMAKACAFILQNIWELTLGKAAVSQGKLPALVKCLQWSMFEEEKGNRDRTWEIATANISCRKSLQPDSTSRVVEALLRSQCPLKTHHSSRAGEEPGICLVLAWWPGGTKVRMCSRKELCQVLQSGWDKDHV